LPPLTPLASAANMRSVQTLDSTHRHGWPSVSAFCLVVANTAIPLAVPRLNFTHQLSCLPSLVRVVLSRRFPLLLPVLGPGGASSFHPPGFPGRLALSGSAACRTMKALTPAASSRACWFSLARQIPAACHPARGRSPCLSRANFRPFLPQPLDAPAHRFVSHFNVDGDFPGFALRMQARRNIPPNQVRLLRTGLSSPVAPHPTFR